MKNKKCSICNKEKPLADFYSYRLKKTKQEYRRSYCVLCKRKYKSEWQAKNKEKQYQYSKNWMRKNRIKYLAHHKLSNAVESGKLIRKPCEICGKKGHGHHTDYKKPLKVKWLCQKHHKEIHNGNGRKSLN